MEEFFVVGNYSLRNNLYFFVLFLTLQTNSITYREISLRSVH